MVFLWFQRHPGRSSGSRESRSSDDGHRGAHIGHWGAECHLLGEGVKLGSITPMGCMDQYLWAFLYTYNMYIDINKICMYVNIYVYIFGVIYI